MDVVNNTCSKRYGARPLRHIEPRKSHDEPLIQLADVIMGAIAYQWNGYTSSPAKLAIAAHIASRLGWAHLDFCTERYEKKCNIWQWLPKTR
jgi:hypothetical protein